MDTYRQHLRLFRPNAWRFTSARMMFAFGTGITLVFFNLYLASIGRTPEFIGLISSARLAGGALFTLPAVFLLDRIGRRRVMLVGAHISLLTWLATVATAQGSLILAFQALGGLGDVLYGLAVVPMMAEISGTRERATLFSVNEGLSLLGLFAGSLCAGPVSLALAGALGAAPESASAYQAVLIASVALRMLGLLPLWRIDHSVDVPISVPTADGPREDRAGVLRYFNLRALLRIQTPIARLALPWLVVFFAGYLVVPYFNLYLKARFAASDTAIGAVYGLFQLSDGISTLLGPAVASWLGTRRVVVGSLLLSSVCLAGIGFGDSFTAVAALIVARAGIIAMLQPIYRAFVINQAPRAEYTIVSLLLSTATNVGQFTGPLVSGRAQTVFGGMREVFAVAIACYLLAALLFRWAMAPRAHAASSGNNDG